ncbi:hypothetical protein JCM14635_34030 [Megalodesulfovibrio paquesii]
MLAASLAIFGLVGAAGLSGCAWISGESAEPAPEAAGNQTAAPAAETGQTVREPVSNTVQESPAPTTPAAPGTSATQAAPSTPVAPIAPLAPVVPVAPVAPASRAIPKTTPTLAGGYFLYATVDDLLAASVQAERDGTYLGDIAPLDAFEYLAGNDTVGRAFKAGKKGELTVKMFAFSVPGKNMDRRVFGYMVDGGGADKTFGHFDTDADGIFDAHFDGLNIKPAMRFDLYEKLKPGQ